MVLVKVVLGVGFPPRALSGNKSTETTNMPAISPLTVGSGRVRYVYEAVLSLLDRSAASSVCPVPLAFSEVRMHGASGCVTFYKLLC